MNHGDAPELRAQAAWLEQRLAELSQMPNVAAGEALGDQKQQQARGAEYAVLLGRVRSQFVQRGIVIDKSEYTAHQAAEAVRKRVEASSAVSTYQDRDSARNSWGASTGASGCYQEGYKAEIEMDYLDFGRRHAESAAPAALLSERGLIVDSNQKQQIQQSTSRSEAAELRAEAAKLRLEVSALRAENYRLRDLQTHTAAAEAAYLAEQVAKYAYYLKTAQATIKHLETALANSDAAAQRQAVQIALLEAENVRLSTAGRELQRRLELVSGSVAGLRAELLGPAAPKDALKNQTLELKTAALEAQGCEPLIALNAAEETAGEAAPAADARQGGDLKEQENAGTTYKPAEIVRAAGNAPAVQLTAESTAKADAAGEDSYKQESGQSAALEKKQEDDLRAENYRTYNSTQQDAKTDNQRAGEAQHKVRAEPPQLAKIEHAGRAAPQAAQRRRVVKKKGLKQ